MQCRGSLAACLQNLCVSLAFGLSAMTCKKQVQNQTSLCLPLDHGTHQSSQASAVCVEPVVYHNPKPRPQIDGCIETVESQ